VFADCTTTPGDWHAWIVTRLDTEMRIGTGYLAFRDGTIGRRTMRSGLHSRDDVHAAVFLSFVGRAVFGGRASDGFLFESRWTKYLAVLNIEKNMQPLLSLEPLHERAKRAGCEALRGE